MNKLTLDQVQEIYYTENAYFDDDFSFSPFGALESHYRHIYFGVDEDPYFTDTPAFIDQVISNVSDDILEWMYDASGPEFYDVIMNCTYDDFHHKYLQRYIDDKKYVGKRFHDNGIYEFVELIIKFNVKVKRHFFDSIVVYDGCPRTIKRLKWMYKHRKQKNDDNKDETTLENNDDNKDETTAENNDDNNDEDDESDIEEEPISDDED